MKPNDFAPHIEIRDAEVIIQLPTQPMLVFSSTLPARKHIQDEGYSEKGWLWCAFREALENTRMELEEMEELFEAIWDKLQAH